MYYYPSIIALYESLRLKLGTITRSYILTQGQIITQVMMISFTKPIGTNTLFLQILLLWSTSNFSTVARF